MPDSSISPSGGMSLQDVLSFGYLYLLVLGIVSDAIYFGQLGVPILSYSDVLDVLLSPITQMERQPALFVVIALTACGAALGLWFAGRRHARRAATDAEYQARLGPERIRSQSVKLQRMLYLMPACVVFSGYLGFALGAGRMRARLLADGELRPDHRVTFTDGVTASVRLIGSNSGYIFYVEEAATEVAIAPIKETVRVLSRLPGSP